MKKLLIALIVIFIAFSLLQPDSVETGPGMKAVSVPEQKAAQTDNETLARIDEYRLTALASFSIQAKILGKKRYYLGRESDLSPIDLALGWGSMSDERVTSQINISQRNRWYYWQTDNFPIPRREIETSSANMHMIPANDTVRDQLLSLSEGQIIELTGYLVRADAPDGWRWISSTTRTDTGNGACELVYVERMRVVL